MARKGRRKPDRDGRSVSLPADNGVKNMAETGKEQQVLTFWDHLEELRKVFFRIAVAVAVLMLAAFFFKEEMFAVLLAPKEADFVIYRLFCRMADVLSVPSLCPEGFYVKLINTRLAAQFVTHMSVSFYAGLLLASPYIIYQLFRFVSPALYAHERKYSVRVAGWGYVLFMAGVLLNYFLIFPLTFRFLATYQVSDAVENAITLSSYMDTLMMMNLMMGIVFEIPVVCWLFAKSGFLTAAFMRRRRRHAVVVILAAGAVVTPTSDVFTLLMVSVPMYVLYEASIWIVSRTEKRRKSVSR